MEEKKTTVIPKVTASETGKAQTLNPNDSSMLQQCDVELTKPIGVVVLMTRSTSSFVEDGNSTGKSEHRRWHSCKTVHNHGNMDKATETGYRSQRVGLLESAAWIKRGWGAIFNSIGGILHLRLNTLWETDSKQVPRGKDQKNSEKRVKRTWSCWKGSN